MARLTTMIQGSKPKTISSRPLSYSGRQPKAGGTHSCKGRETVLAHLSARRSPPHQAVRAPVCLPLPSLQGSAPALQQGPPGWLPSAKPHLPPSPETPPPPGSPPGCDQPGQDVPGPPVSPHHAHLRVPTLVLGALGHAVGAVSSGVPSLACPWLREAAQALSASPPRGEEHRLWSPTRVPAAPAPARLQLLQASVSSSVAWER